ncbi:MAG: hypothetical protein COX51_03930, partial [Syntrophobacteraceae bacterium CG23_combo_of_CG06-09_8_20_14_all_50_8]
ALASSKLAPLRGTFRRSKSCIFYLFSAGNELRQDRFCHHAEFLIERLCFIKAHKVIGIFVFAGFEIVSPPKACGRARAAMR